MCLFCLSICLPVRPYTDRCPSVCCIVSILLCVCVSVSVCIRVCDCVRHTRARGAHIHPLPHVHPTPPLDLPLLSALPSATAPHRYRSSSFLQRARIPNKRAQYIHKKPYVFAKESPAARLTPPSRAHACATCVRINICGILLLLLLLAPLAQTCALSSFRSRSMSCRSGHTWRCGP